MPEVVAGAALAVASTVGSSAAAGTLGSLTVGGILAVAAAGAAAGGIGMVLNRANTDFKAETGGRMQTVRSSDEPHRVIYGRVRVGGTLLYAGTHTVPGDKTNAYLNLLIGHAGHKVFSIQDLIIDGTPYLNPDGVTVNSRWYHPDDPGQLIFDWWASVGASDPAQDPAYATALGQINANVPEWQASDEIRGRAWSYSHARWNDRRFAGGIPDVTAVVQGKECYDPRLTATGWTDNAALCILDYLRDSQYGIGASDDEIDFTNFGEQAGFCDELVLLGKRSSFPTPGTPALYGYTEIADGGGDFDVYQRRYTCNGTFKVDSEPFEVLEAMLSSCAGVITYSGGKFRLHVGVATLPEAQALSEDDLRGPLRVQPRTDRQDLFNATRGTYVDPFQNWQSVDFPPVVNSFYVAQDNGDEIYRDIDLPFTTDPIRALRLAKIALERSRQPIIVEWPGKIGAMRYQIWDVVQVNVARLGWVNKQFRVVGWRLSPEGGVDLTLREEAAESYDWNLGAATGYDPNPDTLLNGPFLPATQPSVPNVPVPHEDPALVISNLQAFSGEQYDAITPEGVRVRRIMISWDEVSSGFVTGYTVRWKLVTGTVSEYLLVDDNAGDVAYGLIDDNDASQQYGLLEGAGAGVPGDIPGEDDWVTGWVPLGRGLTYIAPVHSGYSYLIEVRAHAIRPGPWAQVEHTVDADAVTLQTPTNLLATSDSNNVYLDWTYPADIFWRRTAIHESSTGGTVLDRDAAPKIADTTESHYVRTGLSIGDTRWYWVRAIGPNGALGAWNAINGVQSGPRRLTTQEIEDLDIEFTPEVSPNGFFNGDFEQGQTDWLPFPSGVTVETTGGVTGPNVLRIDVTPSDLTKVVYQQKYVPLAERGEPWRLGGRSKSDQFGALPRIVVYYYQADKLTLSAIKTIDTIALNQGSTFADSYIWGDIQPPTDAAWLRLAVEARNDAGVTSSTWFDSLRAFRKRDYLEIYGDTAPEPYATHTARTGNLIDDPTFALLDIGYEVLAGGGYSIDATGGRAGTPGFKFFGGIPADEIALTDYIEVPRDQHWVVLRGYGRKDSGSPDAGLAAWAYDASKLLISKSAPVIMAFATGFLPGLDSVELPTGTAFIRIVARRNSGSGGTAWLDNVWAGFASVFAEVQGPDKPEDNATLTGNGRNELVNPRFEQGLIGWQPIDIGRARVSDSGGLFGSKAMTIDAQPIIDTLVVNAKPLPTAQGETWIFNGWGKTSAAGVTEAKLYVAELDATQTATLRTSDPLPLNTGSTTWAFAQAQYTVVDPATYFLRFIMAASPENTGSALFDNVEAFRAVAPGHVTPNAIRVQELDSSAATQVITAGFDTTVGGTGFGTAERKDLLHDEVNPTQPFIAVEVGAEDVDPVSGVVWVEITGLINMQFGPRGNTGDPAFENAQWIIGIYVARAGDPFFNDKLFETASAAYSVAPQCTIYDVEPLGIGIHKFYVKFEGANPDVVAGARTFSIKAIKR